MAETEVDLSIGDVLHVGEYVVTVVDIEGTHAIFRIEGDDGPLESALFEAQLPASIAPARE